MSRLRETIWQRNGKQSPEYPAHNPLTKTGRKVIRSMRKQYGKKKGERVFYASINKRKKGSGRWHR